MLPDVMKQTIEQMDADPNYVRLDLYRSELEEFGEREPENQLYIYGGYGMAVEVMDDGSIQRLVPEHPIPDDAPVPMWGNTPRQGVIGYMCKIDFECELGGTDAVIRSSAEKAICAATCGVVEVEVIGRRIIVDETDDEMDGFALEEYAKSVTNKLREVDQKREETDDAN